MEVFHFKDRLPGGGGWGVKRRMDLVLFFHISTKFLSFATLLL